MVLKLKLTTVLSLLTLALLLFHQVPSATGHGGESHGGEEDDGGDGGLDCSYTNTIDLPRGGKIEYVSTNTSISIRMSSTKDDGFLSVGFSEDGMMDGSEVVVGDGHGVSLYSLIGHTARKVVGDARQGALSNATFVQDENGSVLEFSKLLDDGTGNWVVDGNGKNIIIWSVGYTNNIFSGHTGLDRGSITISLSPCSDYGKGGILTYKEKNAKDVFIAHGIFAIAAFAVCMPIAIAAVTARGLFTKDGLWFKIHYYTMAFACVVSFVVFGLSVYAVSNKGSEHFYNAHGIIGLVTMILVTIQVVYALTRPSAPHPAPSSAQDTDIDGITEDGTMQTEKKEKDDVWKDHGKKDKISHRIVWEKVHRLLALFILIGGFYQIHTGLVLYSEIYATKDYSAIFWIVAGVLLFILAGVVLYSKRK